jgi:hypothetical protein
MKRLTSLVAVAVVGLAACGTTGSADDGSAVADGTVDYGDSAAVVIPVEQLPASPRDDSVPSGLDTFSQADPTLPPPAIDLSVLRSGGPPPDGIPSIDTPEFHDAASVDYLGDEDPVIALEIAGDARAYPLEILIWHELVNDTVGGVPVSVAYCPLCNSVTVYEREIDGRVLDFGVSGLLYNSSLVMYDRQTETLWSHFTGEPLYGALGAADLVSIPATIVGFGTWRQEHPDGLVLSRNTGASRNYGVNPYPGYDDVDSQPFLFEGDVDGRFTAMTRVVGIETGDGSEAAAFPLLDLRERGVLTTTLGDREVVAFWVPGSTSALDADAIGRGVDVGATGVFSSTMDGRELTFSAATVADGSAIITDDETGSTWNIFGVATDGEFTGRQLEQLVHIDTFWFAWIAFHPASAVAG